MLQVSVKDECPSLLPAILRLGLGAEGPLGSLPEALNEKRAKPYLPFRWFRLSRNMEGWMP